MKKKLMSLFLKVKILYKELFLSILIKEYNCSFNLENMKIRKLMNFKRKLILYFIFIMISQILYSSSQDYFKIISVQSLDLKKLKTKNKNQSNSESKGKNQAHDPVNIKIDLKFNVENIVRDFNEDPNKKHSAFLDKSNNRPFYFYHILLNNIILYLILYMLSYLKWFEAMYLVIIDYINRTYLHFIDLTDPENIEYINNKNTNKDLKGKKKF